jgi:hypothetical protein
MVEWKDLWFSRCKYELKYPFLSRGLRHCCRSGCLSSIEAPRYCPAVVIRSFTAAQLDCDC